MKIIRKTLHKDSHWIEIEGDYDVPPQTKITLEVVEMTCPSCKKKWITVYINDCVVMGGHAVAITGDVENIESCIDCLFKNMKG